MSEKKSKVKTNIIESLNVSEASELIDGENGVVEEINFCIDLVK